MYVIKNTARGTHTRATRTIAPGRAGSVQRVCGGAIRLGRGDWAVISDAQFQSFYDELAVKQARGMIEVHEGGLKGPLAKFDAKPAAPTPIPVPVEVKHEPKHEPKPAPQEVPRPASPARPAAVVEESVELEAPEPDKPLDKMTKSELVSYAAEVLGEKESELELLTKRQILEKLS